MSERVARARRPGGALTLLLTDRSLVRALVKILMRLPSSSMPFCMCWRVSLFPSLFGPSYAMAARGSLETRHKRARAPSKSRRCSDGVGSFDGALCLKFF